MFGLFGKNNFEALTQGIYTSIVEQSRQPAFYQSFGVPDTPEGRFDMIVVHTFLVLRLLKNETGEGTDLAQAIFDLMFADMDQNLRELGTGDTGIGKKIKAMAEAFYGRVEAYEAGLTGQASLEDALDRNLYRKTATDPAHIASFAHYVRREARQLEDKPLEALLAGDLTFGQPPSLLTENSKENQ